MSQNPQFHGVENGDRVQPVFSMPKVSVRIENHSQVVCEDQRASPKESESQWALAGWVRVRWTLSPQQGINELKIEITRAAVTCANASFSCWSRSPQVSTFIMMYRTHCQRILDTVIRANFDEVGQQASVLKYDKTTPVSWAAVWCLTWKPLMHIVSSLNSHSDPRNWAPLLSPLYIDLLHGLSPSLTSELHPAWLAHEEDSFVQVALHPELQIQKR